MIDVGTKGEVQTSVFQESPAQISSQPYINRCFALSGVNDWTLENLVGWLDRQIDHQDIPAGESAEFLRKVIRGLMAKYGYHGYKYLMALDRFRLRDEMRAAHQPTSRRRTQDGISAFLGNWLCPDRKRGARLSTSRR